MSLTRSNMYALDDLGLRWHDVEYARVHVDGKLKLRVTFFHPEEPTVRAIIGYSYNPGNSAIRAAIKKIRKQKS
jgi:ribosome biogenesis SPOUT family RNA methylase Rps3